MERFGIFELLDALSALPREGADQRAEAGQESPAKEERLWRAAPPSGGAARSGDTEKAPLSDGGTARGREDGASPAAGEGASPNARGGRTSHGREDSASPAAEESASPNAPGGRAAHDPAPKAPGGRTSHDPAPKALESFLKRHDALSKKAEKH